MTNSVYDQVVAEVATDLHLNEETLRAAFSVWLRGPGCVHLSLPSEYNHACYAVYRLTKTRSAFQMTSKSRARWRERAMELGSPGHLRATSDEASAP